MKLYLYIYVFWLIVGIVLAIYFPDVTNVVRMPAKVSGVIEVHTTRYTFPIYFSGYMAIVTLSILAIMYTFGPLKFLDKK